MTEAEWRSATDPIPLLQFLHGKVSERKLRLLGCGVVRTAPFDEDGRTIWVQIPAFEWFHQSAWRFFKTPGGQVIQTDEHVRMTCHEAIEIIELFVDDLTMEAEFASASFVTFGARYSAEPDTWEHDPARKDGAWHREMMAEFLEVVPNPSGLRHVFIEWLQHRSVRWLGLSFFPAVTAFIRDIVGNPFCPVTLDPTWLTSDVLAMARGMYEARDFSAMPILADALQDAGCEHAGILDHCRDPNGSHVRGCWVVDLVLGKS